MKAISGRYGRAVKRSRKRVFFIEVEPEVDPEAPEADSRTDADIAADNETDVDTANSDTEAVYEANSVRTQTDLGMTVMKTV